MKVGGSVLTIRLPPEINSGLKSLAAAEGESASTVVRLLLRQAIARGDIYIPPLRKIETATPIGRADK